MLKRENTTDPEKLRNMDQDMADGIKRLAISHDGRPEGVQRDGRLHLAPPVTNPPGRGGKPILTVMSNAKDDFETKYEIIKEIGKGAFSTVYQCEARDSGNMYAVKMVDLRPLRLNERFNPARLKREVEIMRRLRHPNIIQFHEVYEDTDTLMMIMEYCPGVELFDEILNRKVFHEDDAKVVFFQIASSLFYLHSLNIIHRDIKPENILFVPEPMGDLQNIGLGASFRGPLAKLLDFGLSKNAGKDGSAGKTFVGTPCYLAPEVEYTSKGKGGTYGLPADCWSLGAVLYVMLVARFPEFEQEQYTGKVVVKLRPELWGHISTEACDLIRGLMNTNPNARLTMTGAMQHPWLGHLARSKEQLMKLTVQNYEMSHQLQEEEYELIHIDEDMRQKQGLPDETMTAGGNSVKEQRMVVVCRNNNNSNDGNNTAWNLGAGGGAGVVANAMSSQMLHLTPLLHLQRSIATCFEEAHSVYQHYPDIATQVRRGAVLCRQQLAASTKMLREVEQTASAVLGMFPDLELAVEEGEPVMAANFFTMVRTWVVDLRMLVNSTQTANRASMEQIQHIVEQSTIGLHQEEQRRKSEKASSASYVVPKRIFNALLHTATGGASGGGIGNSVLQLGNGGVAPTMASSLPKVQAASNAVAGVAVEDGASDSVALTAEQVLDLFVALFPSQSHAHKGAGSHKRAGAVAGDRHERQTKEPASMPMIEEQRVFSLDSDPASASASRKPSNLDEFSASAVNVAGEEKDEAEDAGRMVQEEGQTVKEDNNIDKSILQTTPAKGRSSHYVSSSKNLSPGTRKQLQITADVDVEDVDEDDYSSDNNSSGKDGGGPEPSPKAANKLAEALLKLREVDRILEQLSLFWANTEVVLDTLTKKGQHVEQFVGFSTKPRLMARFLERIEEYKRFWEGVAVMCSTYINGVQQQQHDEQDQQDQQDHNNGMYSFLDGNGGGGGAGGAGGASSIGGNFTFTNNGVGDNAQAYMQSSWNYNASGVAPGGSMYSPGVVESLSTVSHNSGNSTAKSPGSASSYTAGGGGPSGVFGSMVGGGAAQQQQQQQYMQHPQQTPASSGAAVQGGGHAGATPPHFYASPQWGMQQQQQQLQQQQSSHNILSTPPPHTTTGDRHPPPPPYNRQQQPPSNASY